MVNNASAAAKSGPVYNDAVVRAFSLAAVLWGVVGMLVGVIIAAQLTWPELNLGIPWLSYGRLRPLHTNAVIFAFGGCASVRVELLRRAAHLAGSAVRRQARLVHLLGLAAGDPGGGDHAAAGLHPARNTPNSEWPIDILITLVGVLRHRVLRHRRHAQGAPHLRGELVLRRLHPDRRLLHIGQQRRHSRSA